MSEPACRTLAGHCSGDSSHSIGNAEAFRRLDLGRRLRSRYPLPVMLQAFRLVAEGSPTQVDDAVAPVAREAQEQDYQGLLILNPGENDSRNIMPPGANNGSSSDP